MVDHYRKGDYSFSHFAENIEDYAIILLNADGIVEDWNKGAENIKGYNATEIIGENFNVFYTAEDRKNKVPEYLLDLAKKNGKVKTEGWRVRKDSTKFWGSISITVTKNDHEQVDGFIKITRDLSERKKSEDLLKQKNAMLLEAERAARMCSWTWDLESDIFGWSESAFDIFNINLDYRLNYEKFIRVIYSEDRAFVKQTVGDILRTKQFKEFSFRILAANKKVKDVTCIAKITFDEEGVPLRAIGTLQDVTEKHNYIRHIEAKNRKLEEIAQMQSHSVRSHIANILGVCEIFDFDNVNENEKTELVKELGEATKKLDNITRDIVMKTYE
ncbi:hypothetical protein CJD36_018215 [Flavipsychrobacter stenotrophus]|uniref:histidine kinase n=1 Tax=Flavipsychrobacter stenotrophus TaxID=2077091 RepID=A0A2S7SSH6_9BACT|nr:PAS domain S-box protein [Flavipsychrobacter stenotrophus]PQJ09860.1 hypothetical protein CJD36_018215 [Flavipsychrobacter stenotrophus]